MNPSTPLKMEKIKEQDSSRKCSAWNDFRLKGFSFPLPKGLAKVFWFRRWVVWVCVLFHSLREANISNLSLLMSLEPFQKFLVVWWGGVVWWLRPILVFSLSLSQAEQYHKSQGHISVIWIWEKCEKFRPPPPSSQSSLHLKCRLFLFWICPPPPPLWTFSTICEIFFLDCSPKVMINQIK